MDGRESGVVDVIRMRETDGGSEQTETETRSPIPFRSRPCPPTPFPLPLSPSTRPLPLWSIPIPSAVSRSLPWPTAKGKAGFPHSRTDPTEASVDVARGRAPFAPFESRAGSSDRFGDFGNRGVWSVLPATESKRKIGRARARTPRPAAPSCGSPVQRRSPSASVPA